jgi:hypothetical protein
MSRNFLASSLDELNQLVPNPPPINHATPIVRLFVACDTLITEVSLLFYDSLHTGTKTLHQSRFGKVLHPLDAFCALLL